MPFDPKSLTNEQIEAVIEEYLHVHPKYFLFCGQRIKVDRTAWERDHPNLRFKGWESSRTGDPGSKDEIIVNK